MPQLILALDLPKKSQNLALCENLAKNGIKNLILKIGLRSFIRDGAAFVRDLQGMDFRIFLDLKLYDIPNTMLDSLAEMVNLGVQIITIHASSGKIAMKEAANFARAQENPPLIFAVTALTSFDESLWREIYNEKIEVSALNFAQMAQDCGIDGVVCSPFESRAIKENFALKTLTPAIRPIRSDFDKKFALKLDSPKDDQSRAASLDFAIQANSDFLVIGRPIYRHEAPVLLTKAILEKLEGKNASV